MSDYEYESFSELNNRLKQNDLNLKLICVGGFVMHCFGMGTTVAIDALYEETQEIREAIKDTGDHLNINLKDEMWLNNSVQNMNRIPPESICETIYDFSNLKVLIPPLEYIAGMKLSGAREQDIQDVAGIIRMKSIDSPETLLKILDGYGFKSPDESLVLESFGLAYGMDWLEKYYIENEEEINNRIRNSISNS